MVRGFPYDHTKRPADHAALKPAAWSRHPAVHQWIGYADALALYLIKNMEIWEQRVSPLTGKPFDNSGMNENIRKWRIAYQENNDQKLIDYQTVKVPHWWSDVRIHDSDKGILYRKDKRHYSMFRKYAMVYEQCKYQMHITSLCHIFIANFIFTFSSHITHLDIWPNQLAAAASQNHVSIKTEPLDEDESPAKKRKRSVKTDPIGSQVYDTQVPVTEQAQISQTNAAISATKSRSARVKVKVEPVDHNEKENATNSPPRVSGGGRKQKSDDFAAPLTVRRSARNLARP